MDPRDDRVELLPEDLPALAQMLRMLRSGRCVSAVLWLRQALDERELEELAWALTRKDRRSGEG